MDDLLLFVAKDFLPTEQSDNNVSGLLQALLDDNQLLQLYPADVFPLTKDSFPAKRRLVNKVGGFLQALLDKDQLIQVYPKLQSLAYKDGFEIVGEESGLSPPITLCEPCKKLMQKPPEACDSVEFLGGMFQPTLYPKFWIPFHTSISQLIACCHSSEGVCRLCHLFWDHLCGDLASSNSVARGADWFKIKIEDEGRMFSVKEDLQEDVEYVAISYRWGSNEQAYMLNADTLGEMRQKQSMHELPKTLRDVCDIAHRMGFEYVWIDRLCIIQDCDEDWHREASTMAMVYTQSSCTIAASCAPDEESGCIKERKAMRVMLLRLKSCPLLRGNNIIIAPENPYYESDLKLGYLADRGWAFQEWLLSTRVIHFGRDQVHWECRQLEAYEKFPTGKRHWLSRPLLDVKSVTESWGGIVRAYSKRKFTYDKDKLPGISGLAQALHELASKQPDTQLGQYYAGLWQSNFIRWLCWWVRLNDEASLPDVYIAPSWSWASLCAEIGLPRIEDDADLAELRDIKLISVSKNDSYASMRDGWITLFGHMKPVQVQFQHQFIPTLVDLDFAPFPFTHRSEVYVDIGKPLPSPFRGPFYYLPLYKDRNKVYSGLLLIHYSSLECNRTRVSKPHTSGGFERAGSACITVWGSDIVEKFEDWLSQSPKEEVIIY
ncbi:heterokaryon incompatibility protein-domain-containing protein [Annulohypoxylon truncatum]|uniref:heterokaryon incompatibility protein-domain-containing protein n=1 Tax=Annulohypoxylon truncatum TaxID=327061 RepID=UPI002007F739|nr:heterokaryon incompatibility protein-domain-containing protein [Annulohypoxylon truncatum]KAI1211928.1 heterokaryon incompatibility protein-domain-containing protein [Annulohypoxylon truncatum]